MHNRPVGATAFEMRVPGGAGGIFSNRPDIFDRAPIGFVDNMLAIHDQGVGQGQMPMQKYLLVWREFDHQVYDIVFFIHIEQGDFEVFKIP